MASSLSLELNPTIPQVVKRVIQARPDLFAQVGATARVE
jgi:hypothetical protein